MIFTNSLSFRETCNDPVTILKEFSHNLRRGRLLDLVSDHELCEGATSEIFVSRFNLFETGMKEILRDDLTDFSIPLEVTFAGESAQDFGGPRREFLGSMMREIRDKLFIEQENMGHKIQEDEAALAKGHYFGAGLVFGKLAKHRLKQGKGFASISIENEFESFPTACYNNLKSTFNCRFQSFARWSSPKFSY